MSFLFLLLFGVFALLTTFLLLNFFMIGVVLLVVFGLIATLCFNPVYSLCGLFILGGVVGIRYFTKKLNQGIVDEKKEKVFKQGKIFCKILIGFSSVVLLAYIIFNIVNYVNRPKRIENGSYSYYFNYLDNNFDKKVQPQQQNNKKLDRNKGKQNKRRMRDPYVMDWFDKDFDDMFEEMNNMMPKVFINGEPLRNANGINGSEKISVSNNGTKYDYSRKNNEEELTYKNKLGEVKYEREKDKEEIKIKLNNGKKYEEKRQRNEKEIFGVDRMLKTAQDALNSKQSSGVEQKKK